MAAELLTSDAASPGLLADYCASYCKEGDTRNQMPVFKKSRVLK